jgi:hypothetical protein
MLEIVPKVRYSVKEKLLKRMALELP